MRRYLAHILVTVGIFALIAPVAFASNGRTSRASSLPVIATNTVSEVLIDTPTSTMRDTPAPDGTGTATNTATATPTGTPASAEAPTGAPTETPIATNTPTPGTLAIPNPQAADFAGVTLNGANQTSTAGLDSFVVSDLRGTGAGWHITAHATRFTGRAGHLLAAGSLKMSAPTVGGLGTLSTILAGPYTIDLADPFQFASAAADTGLGEYTFSATTLTLAIPSDTYADTYESVVTISVVSGP